MKLVEVRSQDVRLPVHALDALDQRAVVAVTHYGRRRHIVMTEEQFALIEPLLEVLEAGGGIPSEHLMTQADIALERALAEDREPSVGENDLIDAVLDEHA